MKENQIEINGALYDIVFIYKGKNDQILLLVTDGQDVYCIGYKEESGHSSVYFVEDEDIAEVVEAYNNFSDNTIFFNGDIYDAVHTFGDVALCQKGNETSVLYPFVLENGIYVPFHLDDAGKLYYKNMYRASLEDNHEYLKTAQPITASASSLKEDQLLTNLDGCKVYLAYEEEGAPKLLFVDALSGKPEVSKEKQQELLKKFILWEDQEYAKANNFVIENLI